MDAQQLYSNTIFSNFVYAEYFYNRSSSLAFPVWASGAEHRAVHRLTPPRSCVRTCACLGVGWGGVVVKVVVVAVVVVVVLVALVVMLVVVLGGAGSGAGRSW